MTAAPRSNVIKAQFRAPEPERIVAYRGAKIHLHINHELVARVLRRKREICGGEMVNGERA